VPIVPITLTTVPTAILWACEDCSVSNTSTEPIPDLPPGYDLAYLYDDCSRAWKEQNEGAGS
jgi:hypothetical protein